MSSYILIAALITVVSVLAFLLISGSVEKKDSYRQRSAAPLRARRELFVDKTFSSSFSTPKYVRKPLKEATGAGFLQKLLKPRFVLIVVTILLFSWVLLAYTTPASKPQAEVNGVQQTEQLEYAKKLSFKLDENNAENQASIQGADGAANSNASITEQININENSKDPDQSLMAEAAQDLVPVISLLEQVGLQLAKKDFNKPMDRQQNLNNRVATPVASNAAVDKAKTPSSSSNKPTKPNDRATRSVQNSRASTSSNNRNVVNSSGVVLPPPVPYNNSVPNNLANAQQYTVHLGSFSDKANAELLKEKLIASGSPAEVSEIKINNKSWYRVMSGRFNTKSEADAHGSKLRNKKLTEKPYLVKPVNQ